MFGKKNYKVEEIFGLSEEIISTYVERIGVDDVFKKAVSNNKNIVVHGCSKQGKTYLRKKYLKENDSISIYCNYQHSLQDIFSLILKAAGQFIPQEMTISEAATKAINARTTGIFSMGYNSESKKNKSANKKAVPVHLHDSNDIIHLLKEISFNKYIVVEDFHYLSEDVQLQFCQNLKVFNELSDIRFILIGVWSDESKINLLNGDLSFRLETINADYWTQHDFHLIISKGEKLLNVKFPEGFIENIIDLSSGSVAFIQEACRRFCQINKVGRTQSKTKQLSQETDIYFQITDIINKESSRFKYFLKNLNSKNRDESMIIKLILLMLVYFKNDILIQGVPIDNMVVFLNSISEIQIERSTLIRVLKNITLLQRHINTRPLLLEYNEGEERIKVIDKIFLIWLSLQNRNDLIHEMNLSERVQLNLLIWSNSVN
jgi:hypothetical protein